MHHTRAGLWLLLDERYVRWKNIPNRPLWLFGSPPEPPFFEPSNSANDYRMRADSNIHELQLTRLLINWARCIGEFFGVFSAVWNLTSHLHLTRYENECFAVSCKKVHIIYVAGNI